MSQFRESIDQNLEAINRATTINDFEHIAAANLVERRDLPLDELTPSQQADLIASRAHDIISQPHIEALLNASKATGEPLRVKFGIDPTGADVHIGHAVPMVLLDRFRRMGQHIVFIVGDFTAMVGDPSGRNSERPPLSEEDVRENLSTYTEQIRPIVDLSAPEVTVVRNSTWHNKQTLQGIMGVLSKVKLGELLQRDDFRKRISENHSLTIAEIMYPVLMGLDSVEVKADIEVGGYDQLLNFQICRKIMESAGLSSEAIVTTDLIPGITGGEAKMSKSLNNYIALNDEPSDMFGKIMSISDDKIRTYLTSLTEISDEEIHTLEKLMEDGRLNPVAAKRMLAITLTSMVHGYQRAIEAHDGFVSNFSKKDYHGSLDTLPNIEISPLDDGTITGALAKKLGVSNSQIRRIAGQRGLKIVSVDGEIIETIDDPEQLKEVISLTVQSGNIHPEQVLMRVGKRNIFRIV